MDAENGGRRRKDLLNARMRQGKRETGGRPGDEIRLKGLLI